jgi:hypothetical protein
MISDQPKRKIKERAASELKKYAVIVLYLWVLLSVLELHRFVVLRELHLKSFSGYRIGFAAVNALIVGKFVSIGEAFHVGERLSGKKLIIYSVLFKSAVFAVFVVCLEFVEEIIVGLIHGKSFSASIPQLGGGGLEGAMLVGVIVFVVLIPLFLLTEVQKAVGKERLRSFMLQERPKRDAA